MFFFPFVISQVVVGLIFTWFYAPGFGLFYKLIESITGDGVAILADERFATFGIIAAGLWPQIAYCMILYLTGLNNINPEQIEAARMDGAKGWKLLWNIRSTAAWPSDLHRRGCHGHRGAALFRPCLDYDRGRTVRGNPCALLLHV